MSIMPWQVVLNSIRDGVIIVDKNGVIRLINPAGVAKLVAAARVVRWGWITIGLEVGR